MITSVIVKLLRWLGVFVLVAATAIAGTLAGFRWHADSREAQPATALAPAGGRFVHAADVDVFVQEAGPPDGPAVVFIHGTGAWSETWRETLNAVARAGWHGIAIDLPPFGLSQRPPTSHYRPVAQGKRIIGVLDALKLSNVVLVGHSFGGGPTVEAALLARERIRALVLVDAALGLGNGTPQTTEVPAAIKGVLATPLLRDALVATFLTNPLFTRRLLQAFIADPAHATDARVAVYRQPLAVQGTTAAVGAWLPELLAPRGIAASRDPASYRSLAMPLLAIWGSRDTITPLDQGHHLVSLVPKARLAVLDGVGHIPQIEDPARFKETLLGFLAGLGP